MDSEIHEYLKTLSQQTKISMKDIVSYLFDIQRKYNILDPDWMEPIVNERVQNILDKQTSNLSEKLELEKQKQVYRTKHEAFKLYVKSLDKDKRKMFLEKILGDINSDRFMDSMHNSKIFKIDGIERWLDYDDDFKPVLGEIDLIPCITGYHIKGNYCDCKKWAQCEIRQEEYLAYLEKSDPTMSKPATKRFITQYYSNDRIKKDYL
jgi:hypothetical protein